MPRGGHDKMPTVVKKRYVEYCARCWSRPVSVRRRGTHADIQAPGLERGHRTLVVTWKGGKVVMIPLAPRTARAIGERTEGPVLPDRSWLHRHGAGRIVRRIARRAKIDKRVGPHRLRHDGRTRPWSPAARRAGSRLAR
jgi:integrase